jgi:hypothetical protein
MSMDLDEGAVREQAYLLWEQDGKPHGRETEYWMRAKVAVAEKSQMDMLTKPAPKRRATPKAAAPKAKPAVVKVKAAASKTKAPPAKTGKAETAKPKPKKK